jgi:hypothetical protein
LKWQGTAVVVEAAVLLTLPTGAVVTPGITVVMQKEGTIPSTLDPTIMVRSLRRPVAEGLGTEGGEVTHIFPLHIPNVHLIPKGARGDPTSNMGLAVMALQAADHRPHIMGLTAAGEDHNLEVLLMALRTVDTMLTRAVMAHMVVVVVVVVGTTMVVTATMVVILRHHIRLVAHLLIHLGGGAGVGNKFMLYP